LWGFLFFLVIQWAVKRKKCSFVPFKKTNKIGQFPMKNYSSFLVLFLFVITLEVNAQNLDSIAKPIDASAPMIAQELVPLSKTIDATSFGLGAGFDFGGIGGNVLIYPHRNIGIFGGVGYAMAGMGYNVGTKLRIISKKSMNDPFALLMYGYNAAIQVKDASQFNKFFYGPTLGIGMDFHSKKKKSVYWSMALMIPIRGSKVDDYITDLEDHHGVEFQTGLPPVALSIGYRIPSREY
jgi:hypothetical protein